MKKIGLIFKEARLKAGLAQKEVSSAMGWDTPQYVSNWERGIANPPLTRIRELCDLLGISKSKIKSAYKQEFEQKLKDAFE